MKNCEYKIISRQLYNDLLDRFDDDRISVELNDLSDLGWRVISVNMMGNCIVITLESQYDDEDTN